MFIYTVGSKLNDTITYAITTETAVLKYGILPPYSSVLTAETILKAIEHCKNMRGKFIICSDSLSTIDAINNTNIKNFYHDKIRSQIIHLSPRIKLIWIPGHAGIVGNEFADQTAKSTHKMPLIFTPNTNPTDINSYLKQTFTLKQKQNLSHCNQWYKNINSNNIHIGNYFSTPHKLNRLDQIKII